MAAWVKLRSTIYSRTKASCFGVKSRSVIVVVRTSLRLNCGCDCIASMPFCIEQIHPQMMRRCRRRQPGWSRHAGRGGRNGLSFLSGFRSALRTGPARCGIGRAMVDQGQTDLHVMAIDRDGRLVVGRRPQEALDVVAERVGFRRHTQDVLVELAVAVLVVEGDDGIASGREVAEDHRTLERRIG